MYGVDYLLGCHKNTDYFYYWPKNIHEKTTAVVCHAAGGAKPPKSIIANILFLSIFYPVMAIPLSLLIAASR